MPASAGLYARVGRSLCQSRPVSMPASAGLYARAGRSLCRYRPVSMPASAGLYAGQPLFGCVAMPSGGFFLRGKQRPEKNNAYLLKK